MDDRKRKGKSTEKVGLVSKVQPLKSISGALWKTCPFSYKLLEVRW